MELMGKFNWYLPSWLRWLPDLRVEPKDIPQEAMRPEMAPGGGGGGE
jgi:RND superfamily putative drug exporter